MVETHGNMKSPAAAPDEIGDPGIGIEDNAGEDAAGREAKLRQLRRDIARLREDVAAITRSRSVEATKLVRRNPWSAMAAALCVGICLGRRQHP
jgi:hypothetical protein